MAPTSMYDTAELTCQNASNAVSRGTGRMHVQARQVLAGAGPLPPEDQDLARLLLPEEGELLAVSLLRSFFDSI